MQSQNMPGRNKETYEKHYHKDNYSPGQNSYLEPREYGVLILDNIYISLKKVRFNM
jgi:hypothetical protein